MASAEARPITAVQRGSGAESLARKPGCETLCIAETILLRGYPYEGQHAKEVRVLKFNNSVNQKVIRDHV